MKNFFNCFFHLLFFLIAAVASGYAQARLVLNGARINISNGANIVIANSASNAITRVDGHIISEGEMNTVKWEIGEATGTYVLPWGYGVNDYLPLTFTKTAGTGNGRFLFSTYHTGWENSLYLPSGVTNANGGGTDLSAFIVDRYWQLNAQGYTVKPALTNLRFTYLEAEHVVSQNTIVENSLAIERWNDDTDTWNLPVSGSSVNTSSNVVTSTSVDAGDLYPWWTLSAGHSILPLIFLSFEAKREQYKTKLLWTTKEELNVDDFDVQRSLNGRDFVTVGIVKANGTNGTNQYVLYDETQQTGKLFYRIKENSNDGSHTFSEARTITINADQSLSVYPNPVQGKKIMLNTTSILPGQYQLSLFDLQGKLVFQSALQFARNIVPLQLDAFTAKGTYLLKIVGDQIIYNKVILID